MEEAIRTFSLHLSLVIEGAAALIITIGIIGAAKDTLLHLLGRGPEDTRKIRLQLGRWLVLALEFLLAADIVRTAVAPSWEEIGQLAAIAVLRTGLNFFLEREIEHEEKQEGEKTSSATVGR